MGGFCCVLGAASVVDCKLHLTSSPSSVSLPLPSCKITPRLPHPIHLTRPAIHRRALRPDPCTTCCCWCRPERTPPIRSLAEIQQAVRRKPDCDARTYQFSVPRSLVEPKHTHALRCAAALVGDAAPGAHPRLFQGVSHRHKKEAAPMRLCVTSHPPSQSVVATPCLVSGAPARSPPRLPARLPACPPCRTRRPCRGPGPPCPPSLPSLPPFLPERTPPTSRADGACVQSLDQGRLADWPFGLADSRTNGLVVCNVRAVLLSPRSPLRTPYTHRRHAHTLTQRTDADAWM
ncbi:hypothetical protein VFPFJ_05280 [Purpureocillium lilacinum]|nr:hypothetical protein VFPFJ_05280 [Purpureocillium lilacinum]OAQ91121.1 hypothetical protein VFPFJ_05280 [Purpureocillium lilacinum]